MTGILLLCDRGKTGSSSYAHWTSITPDIPVFAALARPCASTALDILVFAALAHPCTSKLIVFSSEGNVLIAVTFNDNLGERVRGNEQQEKQSGDGNKVFLHGLDPWAD